MSAPTLNENACKYEGGPMTKRFGGRCHRSHMAAFKKLAAARGMTLTDWYLHVLLQEVQAEKSRVGRIGKEFS